MNAALQSGATVSLAQDPVKTAEGTETGAFLIGGASRTSIADLAKKYGISAVAVAAPAHTLAIKKARVGVYRPWSPSIDEGWTRWVLENYGFEPTSVYNADMRAADLRSRYDVIVLPDMSSKQLMDGFGVGVVPGEYAGGIGQDGLENLREFAREGGTLIALNRTAAALPIPALMSLPVQNILEGVKSDKFFCSGALLRIETEHADLPINFGVSYVSGRQHVPGGPGIRPTRNRASTAPFSRVIPKKPIRWRADCCSILKQSRARPPQSSWSTAKAALSCLDSSRSSEANRTLPISTCLTSSMPSITRLFPPSGLPVPQKRRVFRMQGLRPKKPRPKTRYLNNLWSQPGPGTLIIHPPLRGLSAIMFRGA